MTTPMPEQDVRAVLEDALRSLDDAVIARSSMDASPAISSAQVRIHQALASLTEGGEAEPVVSKIKPYGDMKEPHRHVPLGYGTIYLEETCRLYGFDPYNPMHDVHAPSRGDGELAAAERAGFDAAIKFIRDRRDAYVEEHGNYDWSTGATEFPGNGSDTVGEWDELIEEIEALRDAALSRRPADEGRVEPPSCPTPGACSCPGAPNEWKAHAAKAEAALRDADGPLHNCEQTIRNLSDDGKLHGLPGIVAIADIIRDVRAALSPATGDGAGRAVGDGWRTDHENAPRDGSHFEVCRGPYSATWGFNQSPPMVVHYWSNPGEEGFYLSSGASDAMDCPIEFTHFRLFGPEPRQ